MRRSFLLLATLFFFSTCETDFELESEWADIPIVYAFIDQSDTAHYVRVEKAFLEPGGDANAIAQIPDSIYYDNIGVIIEKTNSGTQFQLERVDGNAEGLPREDGPFAESPNILYKIRAKDIDLDGGDPIRLILNRSDDLPVVTADTRVLTPLELRETSPSSPVNMGYDRNITFVWNAGEEAQIFDFRLRIHYLETEPGGNDFQPKTLEWVLDDDFLREDPGVDRVSFAFMGEQFYIFLGSALEADPAVRRVFEDFDVVVTGGGQELVDFVSIARANTGITSSQFTPTYTNVDGGLGVFTSRTEALREDLTLQPISLDSLREGIYTADLNFQ